jgi:hypothetical protein
MPSESLIREAKDPDQHPMPYSVPKLKDFSTKALDKAADKLLAALAVESDAVKMRTVSKPFAIAGWPAKTACSRKSTTCGSKPRPKRPSGKLDGGSTN